MIKFSNIFIENTTKIFSDEKFNIEFDSINGCKIDSSFYELLLYKSLIGEINNNCGLIIKYYDEKNNLLSEPKISSFNKIISENLTKIYNINKIIINNNICKYITRIEIIFTYNNINVMIFDSISPKKSKFTEKIENNYGIAIPLDKYNTATITNEFYIKYKL